MSAEQEVDAIISEEQLGRAMERDDPFALARQEVVTLLSATGASFKSICADIEAATTRDDCRVAFRRFNDIIRMILLADEGSNDQLVCRAICALEPSKRFKDLLLGHDNVREAISGYKRLVLKDLAGTIRNKGATDVVSEEKDDILFAQFLSKQAAVEPADQGIRRQEKLMALSDSALGEKARKRGVSLMLEDDEFQVVLKKKRSSIPALNNLCTLAGGDVPDGTGKKRLLTREKLRAGLYDPKGLLNLTGPSTNALNRTKKLELLKGAGYEFNFRGKSF